MNRSHSLLKIGSSSEGGERGILEGQREEHHTTLLKGGNGKGTSVASLSSRVRYRSRWQGQKVCLLSTEKRRRGKNLKGSREVAASSQSIRAEPRSLLPSSGASFEKK